MAGLADTASRLLAEFGEPVVFEYETAGTINPATGEGTAGAPVLINGNGYPSRYTSQDVDGSNILSNDTRLIVEKVSERPEKDWRCTVDGTKYRVMDAQPIRRSAADIIYICQLRAQ